MSIELKINNVVLPLPRGYRMNRELETTIFNKEEDVYDFNYPIELPLTEAARVALELPDVLANTIRNRKYTGYLVIDGLWVSEVDVLVLSVSLQAKTCRLSIIGQYAALANEFGAKNVNELAFGLPRFLTRVATGFDEIDYTMPHIEDGAYDYGELRIKYVGSEANAYMTAVAKGTVTDDFLFPKAVDLKGNLPGVTDGIAVINAWDVTRDRYVDADLYNAMAMAWAYMPSVVPANPFSNNQRHFWVPMYKLYRVLEEIFDEAGLTLVSDAVADTEFRKIVLYNTHAVNVGVRGDHYPAVGMTAEYFELYAGQPNIYLEPGKHLPNMTIVEFLRELAKRYNWQYKYDRLNKTVTIKEDRKLIEYPEQLLDMSSVANPKPSINYERSDNFLNGYHFSFEQDSNNDASSEDVADIEPGYTYIGQVATLAGLAALTPVYKDYCYVKNMNAYYGYSDIGWAVLSHNINGYKNSANDNLQEVSTKVLSAPMYQQAVQMIELFAGYVVVATVIGSYYTNDNEIVPMSKIGMTFRFFNYIDFDQERDDVFYAPGVNHPWVPHRFQENRRTPVAHLPTVVTYVGYREGVAGTDKFYSATTGAYDNKGVLISGIYTGSWSCPDDLGIYTDWWMKLVDIMVGSISTEWQILIDAPTYNKMDLNNVLIVIDGLRYVCKKANVVMPFPEVATLQLVRV